MKILWDVFVRSISPGLRSSFILFLALTALSGYSGQAFSRAQITPNSVGGGGCTPMLPTVSIATTPTSYNAPANITLSANYNLGQNSQCVGPDLVSLSYYVNGALLGTSASTLAWNNVMPGTYSVYVVLKTSGTAATSITKTINVALVQPTISLTGPANNTSYNAPANITFSANATGGTYSISSVKFYDGGTLLATIGAAPYTYTAPNLYAGSHAYFALVATSGGTTATSTTSNITVVTVQPTISLTSPASNASYTSPAPVSVPMTVNVTGGSFPTISTVSYYNNGTLLGTATSSPWSYTPTLSAGIYALTATVTTNGGTTAVTTTNTIHVYTSPTISWTGPANNSNFPTNISVPLSVTASAGSFPITSVSYYNGATLLKTVNSAPWSYNPGNLTAGNYAFSATVTDKNGATASTTPSNVTILPAPTITIAGPVDGATILPSTSFTMAPIVSAGGYTISGVSYYTSVGRLICAGTATPAAPAVPWSCPNAGLPSGGYSVYAVVTTTTANASATSLPIILTIGTLAAPVTSVTPLAIPVIAPSLSNPVAGSLPGNLSVSGSGAATYSMPLGIPPGIAGMAPSLVLNYSSQGSNGMLGLGWSLGGLSQIHRCNKTIAQDGKTSGVSFTPSDRLCLDGQRLILLTSPTSGNADADYWTAGATYSTEVANFSRITSYAGPHGLAFKVESKAGRVLLYGDGGDGTSYISAQGRTDGQALMWALGQVQDLSGNYYTVSYTNNAATGEYLPSQINYGSNFTAGIAPDLSVVLNYTTRTDNSIRYVAGSHNDMVSLLSHVYAYTGVYNVTASTLVREYDIGYQLSPSSGRSMIQSVQMQALNPQSKTMVAFPATTFNWGPTALAPTFSQVIPTSPSVTVGPHGEFSGPVAPPAKGIQSEGGPRPRPEFGTIRYDEIIWADFNGDGLTDALYVDKATNKFYIFLTRLGGGFGSPYVWSIPSAALSLIAGQNAALTSNPYSVGYPVGVGQWGMVGDFDGDGTTDIYLFGGIVCMSQMRASPEAGFGSCNLAANSVLGPKLISRNTSDYLVMDTTGSGRADILMRDGSGGPGQSGSQGIRCTSGFANGALTYACAPYGLTNYAITGSCSLTGDEFCTAVNKIGDFNGDHRQDLVRSVDPGYEVNAGTEVCTSDQGGFNCSPWPISLQGATNGVAPVGDLDFDPMLQGTTLIADLNGDGLSDVIYSGKPGFDPTVCYSTGINFDCRPLIPNNGMDAVIHHVGSIDSDGAIKTVAFEYDQNGTTGTWHTCFLQNTNSLNCNQVDATHGPSIGAYNQGLLPDPITTVGSFLNDGTLNFLSYDQNIDNVSSNTYVYNPISSGRAWKLYTFSASPNLAADKLSSVTNGIGHKSSVTYTQGGQPSVYTQYPASGFPIYPQQSVPNPGYLVSALFDSNGQSSSVETDYKYQGQLTDASGRGSLGFSNTSTYSQLTGFNTFTNYGQSWPYTGLVTSTSTVATRDSNTTISSTNNMSNGNQYAYTPIYSPYFAANLIYFPYLQQSTTQLNDLSGKDLGTTVTTAAYDPFGNQSSNVVVSYLTADLPAAFRTTTTNTWDNNTQTCVDPHGASYVIGKLCTTTVTKINEALPYLGNQNGVSLTHSASNWYYGTGLLKTETLEPNHTAISSNDNLQVTNSYPVRDGCGNVKTKTQQWLDPVSATTVSRSTSMSYTPDCRFPATSTNAMGETESYQFDPATGVKTQLTDMNNLVTTLQDDGLGRITSQTLSDLNTTSWAYVQCAGDCPSNATMITVTTHTNAGTPSGVPELSYANPLGQVLRTMSYGFDGTPIMADHQFDTLARQLADYQPFYAYGASNGASAAYPSGIFAIQRTGIDSLNRTTQSKTLDTTGASLYTNTTYAGAVRTIVNPINESRVETRDVLGQLISVVDNATAIKNAPATTTLFAHDPFGNLTQTTDPAGHLIKVAYDVMGHKIQLNDPDLGIINYSVDPLGRTWKQISPKEAALGQATTFNYDVLDRMISRIEPDLNSYFSYDIPGATGAPLTAAQITSCQGTHSCGKLAESYTAPAASGNVGANNSVSNAQDTYTSYRYDSLGRSSNRNERLDPATYNYLYSETVYDIWGREISQISVRGITGHFDLAKVYDLRYNNMGYLQSIEREAVTLWQALTQDAANRVTTAHLASGGTAGDGLITTRCYNAYTGRLDEAVTAPLSKTVSCGTTPAAATIMESYFYDGIGNVSQRNEAWNQNIGGGVAPQSFSEGIAYDGLNRVANSTVSGLAAQAFTYTPDGSISTKTGVGTYNYANGTGTTGGPHAVKTITGTPGVAGNFMYDADGNQMAGNGRSNTWTSFDMPLVVTYTDPNSHVTSTSQFTYGPNHERRTQSQSNGTMIYYGGAQEVAMNGTTLISVKTYWPHGIGVEVDRPAQAGSELDWTHTDNLGSVVAITDVDGNLKEALQYDAWGSRRNTSGAPVAIGTPQVTENTDDKGYTGQEQIDSLELVHLNGRVYDPLIGKFLTGDPEVSEPDNGQNYNRYSYVLNNPMNRTDPTGFESTLNANSTLNDVSASLAVGESATIAVGNSSITFTKNADGNLSTVATGFNSSGNPTQVSSVIQMAAKPVDPSSAESASSSSSALPGQHNTSNPQSSENYSPPGKGFFTPHDDPKAYPGSEIVQVLVTGKKLATDLWNRATGDDAKKAAALASLKENGFSYLTLIMAMRGQVKGVPLSKAAPLPKPGMGKGAVPLVERDPKRRFSRDEVEEGLDELNGKCEGCEKDLEVNDAKGHHIIRHADGGKTVKDNMAVLCPECHNDIHKPE